MEIFKIYIFRIFLGELKGLICNKSARKVCCKDETPSKADTASQLYLPNATKLECGFSSNAEFIVGKAGLSLCHFFQSVHLIKVGKTPN